MIFEKSDVEFHTFQKRKDVNSGTDELGYFSCMKGIDQTGTDVYQD